MKIKKIAILLFSIIFSYNALWAKEEIKRKVLVLYDKNYEVKYSEVHTKLEAILNYYGYYCEYFPNTLENTPKDISQYAGLISWYSGNEHENPIALAKYISKFKNKKNILIGNIPYIDKEGINHFNHINEILEKNFNFSFGNTWAEPKSYIKREYEKSFFNFERQVSFLNNYTFSEVIAKGNKITPLFVEKFNNKTSNSVFLAPWGFYGQVDKLFHYDEDPSMYRWIINPYKLIENVYNTNYPIPDTTTKKGKRISYIHVDGDGILSKSYNNKFTIENGYEFIKKSALKTGVSYIVIELDENGPLFKNNSANKKSFSQSSKLDPKLFNKYAKKTFELPFVEPASHTYTHPFSWRKGQVAYSINPDAKRVLYEGSIKAYQENDKQINIEYEITDSINYLQKLIPNKKIETIYWTGDCYPSIRDLKYIDDNNLLAFNGGDSRFDLEYNSLSYVTALSLYSKEGTQIYSSNSNENTYTNNWQDNYWRFANNVQTFKNTGYPKRIKPVNVYYHFYSFEKYASTKGLEKLYDYLSKNDFEYVYPSEFIRIAKNFHEIKVEQEGQYFYLSNIKTLQEFRFKGKVTVDSNKIKTYYDKKLNVSYMRVKDNIDNIKIKVVPYE